MTVVDLWWNGLWSHYSVYVRASRCYNEATAMYTLIHFKRGSRCVAQLWSNRNKDSSTRNSIGKLLTSISWFFTWSREQKLCRFHVLCDIWKYQTTRKPVTWASNREHEHVSREHNMGPKGQCYAPKFLPMGAYVMCSRVIRTPFYVVGNTFDSFSCSCDSTHGFAQKGACPWVPTDRHSHP